MFIPGKTSIDLCYSFLNIDHEKIKLSDTVTKYKMAFYQKNEVIHFILFITLDKNVCTISSSIISIVSLHDI